MSIIIIILYFYQIIIITIIIIVDLVVPQLQGVEDHEHGTPGEAELHLHAVLARLLLVHLNQ